MNLTHEIARTKGQLRDQGEVPCFVILPLSVFQGLRKQFNMADYEPLQIENLFAVPGDTMGAVYLVHCMRREERYTTGEENGHQEFT